MIFGSLVVVYMLVRGVSREDVEDSAWEVGVRVALKLAVPRTGEEAGFQPYGEFRTWRVRLALGETKRFMRLGGKNLRRVPSVCFHGHKLFMEALFRRRPNAVLKSSFASVRFNGRDDFLEMSEAVGDRRRGDGFPYRMLCACEYPEYVGRTVPCACGETRAVDVNGVAKCRSCSGPVEIVRNKKSAKAFGYGDCCDGPGVPRTAVVGGRKFSVPWCAQCDMWTRRQWEHSVVSHCGK